MANKKITDKSLSVKEPVRKDKTLLLRWFMLGIAVAFTTEWFVHGGFYEHTFVECIVILFTTGITYGLWTEYWLQK